MAKLSLNTRKNIKEYESKQQEHLKRIEAASGILFETEFDWLALEPLAEKAQRKDRIGEIMYSWYLEGLADNVIAFCKDPTQKEAFVETFGAKKRITFEVYDHTKGDPGYYNRTRNDNGTLMMGSNKECFISNTGEIGKDLSVTCSGDSVMNVATRKNIQDFEGKRDENLARINKAVGLEFSLDIDWVPFAKLLSATQAYKDRIGWMIYEAYLESLADNLETLCKDEMSKEAVQEACDKKTIRFALDEKLERGYGDCTFVDGVLTLSFPPARFGSNVGIIGQDIASRL